MAPNRRGAAPAPQPSRTIPAAAANGNTTAAPLAPEPYDIASAPKNEGMITKAEVEARGRGTRENSDSYDASKYWKSEYRVFWTGVLFLTRLPCPTSIDHHPAYLMRSLQWFPIIGAIVGFWGATWLNAFSLLWGPGIAAAVSVLATVWITGALHEDGLADTFDGFGGGWGKSQILRIMKDSRIGTYALVGMVVVLSIKFKCIETLLVLEEQQQQKNYIHNSNSNGSIDGFSAVSSLQNTPYTPSAGAVLIAAHSICRWTSLPLIYFVHYIQDEDDAKRGLYNWFAQSKTLLTLPRLFFGTVTAVIIPLLAVGLERAVVLYATVISITLLSSYYGKLVLGGIVGDYLGATIQVAEVACYLMLTARWEKVVEEWQVFVILAVVAAVPVIYCRRIVRAVDC
jgi:adenosylcobinamide-GDP ribazoletransferase